MMQRHRQTDAFGCSIMKPSVAPLVFVTAGLPNCFQEKLGFYGHYTLNHFDARGRLINSYEFHNGITDAGVAYVYDAAFHASAALSPWYIGLIDNSGYSALAAADTMASHAGWNEFTTYTEANRVEWAEGATAARSITNATAASFSISGSGTVKGAFLVSNNTKSGTTGTLWSTGVFASPPTVANGETLKVTYTLTG
jgi:hypothetical protein